MISMGTTRGSARVAGVAWLADLDFAPGMVRFTTAPVTLVVGGHSYTGVGSLGAVSDVTEGPDSAAEQLTLSLSVSDSAVLALAVGRVEDYRGRSVSLSLQLLDDTFQPDGPPNLRWRGVMNKVQISRKPAELEGSGPGTGTIEMLCTRSGMARARHAAGLRLTDAQQQARYPGDTGLRYVRTLIAQPAAWLTKAFQQIPG